MTNGSSERSRRSQYLDELINETIDPNHKRLIEFYYKQLEAENLVEALESEFAGILMEILDREN